MIPYDETLYGATLEWSDSDANTYQEVGNEWVKLIPRRPTPKMRRDGHPDFYPPEVRFKYKPVYPPKGAPSVRTTATWRITLEDDTCYKWDGWVVSLRPDTLISTVHVTTDILLCED